MGDKLKYLARVLKVKSGAPSKDPQEDPIKMLLVSFTLILTWNWVSQKLCDIIPLMANGL